MPRKLVDKTPIRIAKGTTLRPLEFQFVDAAEQPIDCTGDTVTFSMVLHASPSGTPILDAVAAITVDASIGRFNYKFGSAFWATAPAAGKYRCWLTRTASGESEPLPGNSDYLLVEIYDIQEDAQ